MVALTRGPATAAALREFYGDLPAETTRSVVVFMDGRPVGVVGAAIAGGYATLFSDTKPELEPYLRTPTVMRAVRVGIDIAKRTGLAVVAFAEAVGGCRILEREGFVETDEPGWMRWDP